MSYNGSGQFNINSTGQPVVSGTTISSSDFNALTTDLATGLSTAICKDGQTTVTANLPMNSHKLTGMADGSARSDSATLGNIQDGTGVYVGTAGGTADVITLTPSPAITAYATGQTFRFVASGANTTNVTVNVSGLGAKALTKNGTTALVANDLASGQLVQCTYDGTRFLLQNLNTVTINSPTLVTPALGTPTSGTLTNCTGLPVATLANLGAGMSTFLTTPSSANLAATVTDETGSGALVFGTSPTIASPTLSGTVAGTYTLGGTPTVASATLSNPTFTGTVGWSGSVIQLATPQATTSGVSIDFSSIPNWVRRVTVMLDGVSTNGTSNYLIRLGAGGIKVSGYVGGVYAGSVGEYTDTTGFVIAAPGTNAGVFQGSITFSLLKSSTNTWVCAGNLRRSDAVQTWMVAGSASLSAALDTIRLTVANGSDTFDAGVMNIQYE